MYHLNREDISKLKDIGFEKVVSDFGDIIGAKFGGAEEDLLEARNWVRHALNELSLVLDPNNHIHLNDEE